MKSKFKFFLFAFARKPHVFKLGMNPPSRLRCFGGQVGEVNRTDDRLRRNEVDTKAFKPWCTSLFGLFCCLAVHLDACKEKHHLDSEVSEGCGEATVEAGGLQDEPLVTEFFRILIGRLKEYPKGGDLMSVIAASGKTIKMLPPHLQQSANVYILQLLQTMFFRYHQHFPSVENMIRDFGNTLDEYPNLCAAIRHMLEEANSPGPLGVPVSLRPEDIPECLVRIESVYGLKRQIEEHLSELSDNDSQVAFSLLDSGISDRLACCEDIVVLQKIRGYLQQILRADSIADKDSLARELFSCFDQKSEERGGVPEDF